LERTLKRAVDMQREYQGYLDFGAEEQIIRAKLLAVKAPPPLVP
jgi:hypothetical protein